MRCIYKFEDWLLIMIPQHLQSMQNDYFILIWQFTCWLLIFFHIPSFNNLFLHLYFFLCFTRYFYIVRFVMLGDAVLRKNISFWQKKGKKDVSFLSIRFLQSLNLFVFLRFVKPMKNKSATEGETAVIECRTSGSPKPKLTWSKDGVNFEETRQDHFFAADNQLLVIVNTRLADSGL